MNSVVIGGVFYPVHVLTTEDVERSSTLEASDIGRKYVLVRGCVQFLHDEPAYNEDLAPYFPNGED